MRHQDKTLIPNALILSWLVVAIVLFILANRVSHLQISTFPTWKIFTERLTQISLSKYTLDLLGALIGVSIFSLCCLSLGLSILHNLRTSAPSLMALGATSFVLGEIIFSLLFLTIISVYQLSPLTVALFLVAAAITGIPSLLNYVIALPHFRLSSEFSQTDKLIARLACSVLFIALLYSSARLGYDATAEYFSHSKIMAVSQHPIFFYPKDAFVVSSFHPGILLTAIIQLFGDQAARLFSWVNGLVILLISLAIAQETGLTPRAQLWFLTLVLTSTAFVDLLGDGKIELISTVPILTAIYWMLRSIDQPSKKIFALIGILAGFAIISRPYNFFLVGFFITIFYIEWLFSQNHNSHFNIRTFTQAALWILPPLFLLGMFHLFQNWIWLKNPIAPLTYARKLSASDWQWQFDPTMLETYRLLYPFVLTFINSPQSLGNISPLIIGFLPFLSIKTIRQHIKFSKKMQRLSQSIIVTLGVWIVCFFTIVEIRYVLFLWLMLFLPGAQLIENTIQWSGKPISPMIRPILIILLTYMSFRVFSIAVDTYSPIDKNGQAQCNEINFCAYLGLVNQNATLGQRVFVLNAYRYYLRPDLFACSSQVNEYYELEPFVTQKSPEFWIELYKKGFKFVIFESHLSEKRFLFGMLPDPALAPSWMHIRTLSTTVTKNRMIYQIIALNPPISPEKTCLQDNAGIWQIIPNSDIIK